MTASRLAPVIEAREQLEERARLAGHHAEEPADAREALFGLREMPFCDETHHGPGSGPSAGTTDDHGRDRHADLDIECALSPTCNFAGYFEPIRGSMTCAAVLVSATAVPTSTTKYVLPAERSA
jgi:hypothetical protein